MNTTDRKLGAIILAAGRGKRMNLEEKNKVTLSLGTKPIILHIVHFMERLRIHPIVIVVGHAKESVKAAVASEDILFAEQEEQLGTGHAVQVALETLPSEVTDVFIVYGDDAVFYSEDNMSLMQELFDTHFANGNAFTFVTIEQDDPTGLGRIVRDENEKVLAIVEEKDATDEQKAIHEINPGCFVFQVSFLKKYLPKVEKSPATGEYYLTSLIDIALKEQEVVSAVKGGKRIWRGVNTPEELEIAENLLGKTA